LKQLGLALANYESTHGCYPPAGWDHWEYAYSWRAHLLPFIDEKPTYDAINFSNNSMWGSFANDWDVTYGGDGEQGEWSWGKNNTTAHTKTISAFLCPSDTQPGNDDFPNAGVSNYAACEGVDRYVTDWKPNGAHYFPSTWDSAYNPARGIRNKNIGDGLSKTVAFSEWVKGHAEGVTYRGALNEIYADMGAPPWVNNSQPSAINGSVKSLDGMVQSCRLQAGNSGVGAWHWKGEMWIYGSSGRNCYNHVAPPNDPSCSYGGLSNRGNAEGSITASSQHPGGVNVAMCDGSVQWANDQIDLDLWRAMATRDLKD
jgi:prepilin-type processing-associated H-X9-DG protein